MWLFQHSIGAVIHVCVPFLHARKHHVSALANQVFKHLHCSSTYIVNEMQLTSTSYSQELPYMHASVLACMCYIGDHVRVVAVVVHLFQVPKHTLTPYEDVRMRASLKSAVHVMT